MTFVDRVASGQVLHQLYEFAAGWFAVKQIGKTKIEFGNQGSTADWDAKITPFYTSTLIGTEPGWFLRRRIAETDVRRFEWKATFELKIAQVDAFDDKCLRFLDTVLVRKESDGELNDLSAGQRQFFLRCVAELATFHLQFDNLPGREVAETIRFPSATRCQAIAVRVSINSF